jgi:hypothetical protein
MNNAYLAARVAQLQAITSGNLKVCLLDDTYPGGRTSLDVDATYTDVSAYVIPGTTNVKSLQNVSVSAEAVLDADDPTFTALDAGHTIGFICIFLDNNADVDGAPTEPALSPVRFLLDSAGGIGAGTNGSDVEIQWNAAGIWQG